MKILYKIVNIIIHLQLKKIRVKFYQAVKNKVNHLNFFYNSCITFDVFTEIVIVFFQ